MMNLNSIKDQAKDGVRNIWLAGLGVVATAEQNSKMAFGGLVEKGQTYRAEKSDEDGTPSPSASERAKQLIGKIEAPMVNGVKGVLTRMGVPNRDEVQSLSASVEKLTLKVETLQA